MKKEMIYSALILGCAMQFSTANTFQIVITKNHNKFDDVLVEENILYSCKDILDAGLSVGDGNYNIKLKDGDEFSIYCDMTTDGGGWTRLDNTALEDSDFFDVNFTHFSGFENYWENGYLVFGDTISSLGHDSRFDIIMPFLYNEFYLKDYTVKSKKGMIETAYDFTNYNWDTEVPSSALGGGWGDILFGSVDNLNPTTSYSNEGINSQTSAGNDIVFPNSNIFPIGISSNTISVRSVEGGGEDEDLYIWYSGYIFVR